MTADMAVKVDGVTFADLPPSLEAVSDHEVLDRCRVLKDGRVIDRVQKIPLDKLRIAMVGAWGVHCGISTYAEALWPLMGNRVLEWRVFAEDDPAMTVVADHIVPGLWKRNNSLQGLADALFDFAPDAVFIQHEYGIFPDARHWLAFMSRIRELRPIVTFHSVYSHRDKTICEAAAPEIVVHSDLARKVLVEEKGLQSVVHVIPHGCGKLRADPLYNLYRSRHNFMQVGFGFRYKNWEASINATALLREKYPDVFFTGLFSEGMFSKLEHDRYHAELVDLVDRLKLRDHVAIIRGYQSEAAIDSFLGTNQAAVFPYRNDPHHVVYGASGAARRAMEAGIPVVVSNVPHFADFGGTCPQADDADGLACHLASIFDDKATRDRIVAAQATFLERNSWENCAAAYLGLV